MLMQRETELTKRLMERTSLFFIVLFLLMMLSSCKLGFESTKFYNQRRRNVDISVDVGTEDESDEKISDMDSLDKDKINKLFEDAEKNKDAPFPANKFDDWVFYFVDLTNQNVGTYRFDNSGTWTDDGNHGEIFSNGKAVGSGVRILNDVKYYRYKDRAARWQAVSYTDFDPFTPELDPDGKLKKREERFLFFRFTAQSGAGPLDNTMLCVDTYTKFCWYYAEPAWLDSILGNKVPKDWVDFESPVISTSGECEHTRSYGKFYYYDPVGYVQEDGSVVLYDWAKKDLARNYFNPRQNYLETAEYDPNKPGKSPYYVVSSAGGSGTEVQIPEIPIPLHDDGLLVQMSYIRNQDFSAIEQTSKHSLSYAYLSAYSEADIGTVEPVARIETHPEKINVDTVQVLARENNFLIRPEQLQKAGNFKLKTGLTFANKQLFINKKGIDIELVPENYGVLVFNLIPETTTEKAHLVFEGIENAEFNNGYRGAVRITCPNLTEGQKIPLDQALHFELLYKIDGEFYNVSLERRAIDAILAVGYTFDFAGFEKLQGRILAVKAKSIKNIDLDNYADDTNAGGKRLQNHTNFEVDFQVNMNRSWKSVWSFNRERGKVVKNETRYMDNTLSCMRSFNQSETAEKFQLFTKIIKHDELYGLLGKSKGFRYKDEISDKAKDKISFKYDKISDCWVLDSAANNALGKDKVTITTIPSDFKLHFGEEVDFTVHYDIDNLSERTSGSLEVTYTISWK